MTVDSVVAEALPDLHISNEGEAFDLLRRALEGRVEPWGSVKFDGWPSLELHFTGEKFDQTVTPKVMKALLEYQQGIYHSFAAVKYGDESKRLTDEEKELLEIRVRVSGGSSNLLVDVQDIAAEFLKQLGARMEPVHVLALTMTFVVLYFGRSALKDYLEHRKEVRLRELSDETQRATLEAMKFSSEQETERLKVITVALKSDRRLIEVAEIARDAQLELLKAATDADSTEIDGIEVPRETAVSLIKNARRRAQQVRLDGMYRIMRIDWSDSIQFRVRIMNTETGLEVDAAIQDESLDGRYKQLLRDAEWNRRAIFLQINAKRVGDDDYSNAVILLVCRRRSKFEPPCRLNIEPGVEADFELVGCG